jgi:hypothetical protein
MRGIAVGAVLDDAHPVGDESHRPVVVCVGINYGQFDPKAVAPFPPLTWKSTGMRRRLGYVFKMVGDDCVRGLASIKVQDTHLVAANFFPWITRHEWTSIGLSGIAETLALRCWGAEDPVGRIADLIARIQRAASGSPRNLPAVVFHGAGSAVPYLGVEVIRRLGSSPGQTNWILSDNLSRQSQPINAVALRPTAALGGSRSDDHSLDDE